MEVSGLFRPVFYHDIWLILRKLVVLARRLPDELRRRLRWEPSRVEVRMVVVHRIPDQMVGSGTFKPRAVEILSSNYMTAKRRGSSHHAEHVPLMCGGVPLSPMSVCQADEGFHVIPMCIRQISRGTMALWWVVH